MHYSYDDLYIERNFDSYNKELPVMPSHPSHKTPHPNSLVDLNFNRKPHEEKAYVCFGVGQNSLGLTLKVPSSKAHLIPVLQQARIKYEIVN